jgi:hypothetical protein
VRVLVFSLNVVFWKKGGKCRCGEIFMKDASAREEPGVAFSGKCDDSSRNGFAIVFEAISFVVNCCLRVRIRPGSLKSGSDDRLPGARVSGHMISPIIMWCSVSHEYYSTVEIRPCSSSSSFYSLDGI